MKVANNRFMYNGFNLVVGNANGGAWYCGNRGDAQIAEACRVPDGVVCGVSNGTLVLGKSNWPKVERGKELFAKELEEADSPDDLIQRLAAVLRDKTTYPDESLPPNMFDYDLERRICPICIDRERCGKRYGTRTHTVLVIEKDDEVRYWESSRYKVEPDGEIKEEADSKTFKFKGLVV
ncbi:hypothetical protein HK104_000620 [Borealophlyctis nickersoniae]|nr:hypothetical protein HK104_000620 [Borealophlyctis nickersoniae]